MYYDTAEISPSLSSEMIQEIQIKLMAAVQLMLDKSVQERGYENIQSACSYALSRTPEFSAEGQVYVNWCDAVWTKCYMLFEEMFSGRMRIPKEEEFIALLPELTGAKRRWIATD